MHTDDIEPQIHFPEERSPVFSCALFGILEGKHIHIVITVPFSLALLAMDVYDRTDRASRSAK